MSGGTGLHLINVGSSHLNNVAVDGQYGTHKLYNGAWFDASFIDVWDGVMAAGQNDAIRVSGTASGDSDIWIENGKISNSAVGVHQGGGFGGLYLGHLDIIGNTTNVLYDDGITTTKNAQLVLEPGSYVDSASGNGIVINQTGSGGMSGGYQILLLGWVAGNTDNGIWIEKCPSCDVQVLGTTVIGNFEDGVRLDDNSAVLDIQGTIDFNAQTSGWGLDCTVATNVNTSKMAVHDNTRSSTHYEINPNCTQNRVNVSSALGALPTGTSNTSGVMMGIAGSFTPKFTGIVRLTACGQGYNNTLGQNATFTLRYGTGTAPTNGAAVSGTAAGSGITVYPAAANGPATFCLNLIVTGLTPWTSYWYDLEQQPSADTAFSANDQLTAEEID